MAIPNLSLFDKFTNFLSLRVTVGQYRQTQRYLDIKDGVQFYFKGSPILIYTRDD